MRNTTVRLLRGPIFVLVALCIAAAPLAAQNTTAKVRGTVVDISGSTVAQAAVAVVNTETGQKTAVVTGPLGVYTLSLAPGAYDITVSAPGHQETRKSIRVQVGQELELGFTLKPGTTVAGAVSVVGSAPTETLVEMKTSEVATNVTEEQIRSLPQATRNFLSFAALAPGVRLSHDELRQEISYGAQGATNTNVFIDGASYKNDILLGGAVGQDSSRGNPFPQNAIQEFRVITQNFKAEYQKASSVIITAVTKSGGNDFHGDLFAAYQNKGLVAQDKFSAAAALDKPDYTRWQPGVALGGPIVKDNLHFFVSYEGNYQDRGYPVLLGNDTNWPASFRSTFQPYVGNYTSPFRETLLFGKVSAVLSEGSNLDISGDLRHETDIKDFGQQLSYQSATNVQNDIGTIRAKHTVLSGTILNEATLSYQEYRWNPVPIDQSFVAQNFQGLMQIGSKDSIQDFTQGRLGIRDDFSVMNFQAGGDHSFKVGANLDFLRYKVIKSLNGVPTFNYRPATYSSTPGDMPFNAVYGTGNPDMSTSNRQIGIYLQDDWRLNQRFTVNVGIRWDYESDMLNNGYVTPASIRAGLESVYGPNYFTDGSNRPIYWKTFQPRLGFSWDITGDGRTVAHGGYGRYYDRTLYNDILDEKFRQQWQIRKFWFSKDGSPQDTNPALKWNPAYLSKAALDAMIANGMAPQPEIFLLANDTRPPSSDQLSLGLRHDFGKFNTSAAYTYVHSKDQMTWTCGIKAADGSCDWGARPAPGLGFSMISRGKESWFYSIQLAADKPYTGVSNWGASLSYVYGSAEQTGNDLFSWGKFDPVNGIRQRSPIAQKHQITATAIVGLPFGFKASTLISLGSGYPFGNNDCSKGYDKCVEAIGGGDPPKWTESVDLRLEKKFRVASTADAGIYVEAINVFNFTNEQYYDGWIPALPDVNTHFAQAGGAYNPRRIQFGVNLGF